MRELCILLKTEKFQEQRVASVRSSTILKQVYSRLKMYRLYRLSKKIKMAKAMDFRA